MNSLTISNKNVLLYACSALLCLIIFIRDIMGIGIPNITFAVIVCVAALVLKLDSFKMFLFFLFPYTCGVPGYTMLVGIIALLAKSFGNTQIRKLQIIPTVLIAFLEFFNNVIHISNFDISAYMSFISFTAVFFFMLFDKSNYERSRECVIAFIAGTIFVTVVIYYKMIVAFGLDMILMGQLRGAMGDISEEGTGKLITNGNNIAYLSIILVSILLIGAKKLKLPVILYYSLLLLSVLIGMGSFSRTWMLLIALIIVIYLIYQRNFKALLSLLFLCGTIVFIFPDILEAFSNVMINRMTGENIETGGGRTEIFTHYNELWSQNLLYVLFGVGVTSYYDVLQYGHAMHNSIQQIYVCLGVIGLILYVYLFSKFFKTRYIGKTTFLNYLPFIAGVIFLQSIQFLRPYFLMLPLIPAFYAFYIRK